MTPRTAWLVVLAFVLGTVLFLGASIWRVVEPSTRWPSGDGDRVVIHP